MTPSAILLVVVALLSANCGPATPGPRSGERPVASTPSATPTQQEQGITQEQGTTTEGQIFPEKGEFPPGPKLTPEEHERLLQGTRRRVPDASGSDADRPGPPAR